MTKFEKIEQIWNDLESAYAKSGNGKTPMEFMQGLLNKNEAGKRALLKLIRESEGVTSECIEDLARKIELAFSNWQYFNESGFEPESVSVFLQRRSSAVCLNDFELIPLVEKVSASQLLATGHVFPVRKVIKIDGVRKICSQFCEDYSYVCETENDIVTMFQQLKDSGSDNATLFGLAAFISAGELKTPLVVTNTKVANDIQERFSPKCSAKELKGREYKALFCDDACVLVV